MSTGRCVWVGVDVGGVSGNRHNVCRCVHMLTIVGYESSAINHSKTSTWSMRGGTCHRIGCYCVHPSNRLTSLSSSVKCKRHPASPELPLDRTPVESWSEADRSPTRTELLPTDSQRTRNTRSTEGRRRSALIRSTFVWERELR